MKRPLLLGRLLSLVLALGAHAAPPPVDALETRATQHLGPGHESMSARREALRGIVAQDGLEAARALVRVAEKASGETQRIARADALHSLRQLRSPETAPVFVSLLSSSDKGLRDAAIDVLRELGVPEAAPRLRALAFSDAEAPYLRGRALEALAASTDDPADVHRMVELLRERATQHAAERALRRLSRRALAPALFPGLRDPALRGHHRVILCEALGRLGHPDAAVPLLDVVEHDESFPAKEAAARALKSSVEPEHVPRLVRILDDRVPSGYLNDLVDALLQADRRDGWRTARRLFARKDGALALQLLYGAAREPHPSDEALARLGLGSKDHMARAAAVELLSYLDTTSAEQTLCAVLSRRDEHFHVRAAAAAGLGRFRSDDAIACLIRTMPGEKLKDDRSTTWSAMVRSLERITGEKLGDDFRAWRTWHAGGLRAGLDGLLQGLTHDDAAVRALAAARLAKHEAREAERPKVLAALLTALERERANDAIAELANALGALGERAAIDALVTKLEQSRGYEARLALARALDRLGDARGSLHFLEELERGDERARADAVRALAAITGEPPHGDVAAWRDWWKRHAERYRAP